MRRHYRKRSPEAVEQEERQGLQRRQDRFKKLLETDTDFYIVYCSTNVAATWLSFLSVALVNDLSEPGEEREPLNEQVAALAFFSRLANDLWAIVELVESGFDLQARALTRAFLEHVDVLICCIQDKELTREFVEAREPDEAIAFWHKYVSKNRAKAKVNKFIAGPRIGASIDRRNPPGGRRICGVGATPPDRHGRSSDCFWRSRRRLRLIPYLS